MRKAGEEAKERPVFSLNDAPDEPPAGGGDRYPPYVATGDQRRRWNLARAVATELLAVDGEPVPEAEVWLMTRSLFHNPDIET